ncbi:uncharacterized protein PHALS_15113 [Plasmopara halstedii]|uniref:Uncharacterized protein n=1 Tax=Plasmopara halstedii TaxID=4781 RepID=A0A0P1ABD1_PLAHL|nr:uncharacterized protein PHALS_15113 [Plasmopara halstedii]CEG37708.1 hypothetical protein PHALS_15113 [Plasmopara halstedii]|eukprot:XP_024574077.1 hypothetical protein PHALS_15113 [Plasmopara halstedii]
MKLGLSGSQTSPVTHFYFSRLQLISTKSLHTPATFRNFTSSLATFGSSLGSNYRLDAGKAGTCQFS